MDRRHGRNRGHPKGFITVGSHRPPPPRAAGQPGDRPATRASQRGQSLVELSLMLPMLLLLTVVALDFGRVYLGYINVQNMARIAANLAGNNPEAWSTMLDETRPGALPQRDPRGRDPDQLPSCPSSAASRSSRTRCSPTSTATGPRWAWVTG